MNSSLIITKDRVRDSTSDKQNREIDQQIEENLSYYGYQDKEAIKSRIFELDKEWDIERTLELNASIVALTALLLTATVSKKWLILPIIVTTFLAQHAIQGWCPPLPLFRRMKIRTRKEIDKEKFGLLEVLKKHQ